MMNIRFALLGCLALASAHAEEPLPSSPVCWPPNYAGIVLGVTTDGEVERLLGKGLVVKDEGEDPRRYFIDAKGTATLYAVGFTDAVIGELVFESGIAIPPKGRAAATSRWFDPSQGFGNRHALRLGSTKTEVRANLGPPTSESTEDGWRYDSRCMCELEIYFTLYFKNDRVTRVVFSAPPG
jgi:hypothetical protein